MFCLVTRDIIFFLLGDGNVGDGTSVVGGRGDGVLMLSYHTGNGISYASCYIMVTN